MALLNMNDNDDEENKEETDDNILSLILQMYDIPCADNDVSELFDRFMEFRMFISNKRPTAITQIQTFLNIMSQDHIKQATESFIIPLRKETINEWNLILNEQSIDDGNDDDNKEEKKEMEKESAMDEFKLNLKRILFDKYNEIKDILTLQDVDKFCIDFVIIKEKNNNGYNVKISNIHRLPIYPHDYGLFIWNSDKDLILNTNNNDKCEILIREASGIADNNSKDEVKFVLRANVYSCNMDYFVKRQWIKDEEMKSSTRKTASKFCNIL